MSKVKFHDYKPKDKHMLWVPCSDGNIPHDAVCGGEDLGVNLYVARGVLDGVLIPGKLHPEYKLCYVAWDGKEHALSDYEILIDPKNKLKWSSSSDGEKVDKAVIGGKDASGQKYLIGRAVVSGVLSVGKVHPDHNVCYLPYGGQEHAVEEYEILKHE